MDEQRAPKPLVPPEATSPEATSAEGSVVPAEPTERSTDPTPGGKESGAIAAAMTTPPGMRAAFRPAQSPTRPFLIALLPGILSTVIFVLSAGALFVFGVGVALAFFLVPVVGWLVGHGRPPWLAAIAVVAVTLLGALIVILAVGMVVIGVVTDSQLPIDFAILLGLVAFVMELIPRSGPSATSRRSAWPWPPGPPPSSP